MNFKKKLLILLFVTALTNMGVAQTTYYVNQQTGSNTNNGLSTGNPFKTVEKAVTVLSAGDTLLIMGVYANASYNPTYSYSGNINDPQIWHQENTIRINNLNGTAGNYITIKPYDSNTVLKGDGANILRVTNCSYLKFEGLEIMGEVDRIPYSTARALQFLYREDPSTNTLYRVPFGTTDAEVEQNYSQPGSLPDISNISVSRPSYTDTRGLYMSRVHHIDITNLKVHHTPGNGFRVADCDYINIIGNEVYATSRKSFSGTHGMVVTNANSSVQGFLDTNPGYRINILNNKVHHNYNEIYSWAPDKTLITPKIDEGKGISLQRNDLANGWNYGRFLVANNLAYWNGYSGIHSNSGLRMDFINNTCYMNSYTNSITNLGGEQSGNNIGMSTSGNNSDDFKFINNIIFIDNAWGGFPISIAETTNVVVSNNLVFGINGSLNQDSDATSIQTNMYFINPKFVNAGDELAVSHDFGLQSSSEAIGKANKDIAPTTDYFGKTRDGQPDLGAIEYFPSLGTNDNAISKFNVYPNPVKDYIYMDGIENINTVEVYNIAGQKLLSNRITSEDSNSGINLSSLSSGIYFLKVNSDTFKIVKQ
ncbi:T9SS type A sorting domain-containing protein [Flavobacterium sp. NG2]|uniref:T9SS type A sorting domain-containing protein n=1 Tax=Flavobacterium sp. NG2 TaxID=3097547 RepID=UPI002A806921|nr:T9SS type A sorting domain-containing protein [Flavobacterium sp. NG2]WPR71948.1 T9SS type A sorting domain-containing protein [Flavobacterium sp. NG2]